MDETETLASAIEAQITAAPSVPLQPHGWTPFNQSWFLRMIADGRSVESACEMIDLSTQSLYALRRRPHGAALAIGWEAARLLAHERLADVAATRALEGWEEVVTRTRDEATNTVTTTRRRLDNGLLSRTLARHDAVVEGLRREDRLVAAQLIACDFDRFLSLVRDGATPARIGLYLAARIAEEGGGDDLTALAALARADLFERTGDTVVAEIDTADLEPEHRARWTADQWRRAEATGLVVLAPADPAAPAENAFGPQSCQPCQPDNGPADAADDYDDARFDDPAPLWEDAESGGWRTAYPPPPGFVGHEIGDYGDPDYEREVSLRELAVLAREEDERRARLHASGAAARDDRFGFVPAPHDPANVAAGLIDDLWPEDDDEESEEDDTCCKSSPLPGEGRGSGVGGPPQALQSEESNPPPTSPLQGGEPTTPAPLHPTSVPPPERPSAHVVDGP